MRRPLSICAGALLSAACGSQPTPAGIGTLTQAIRAATGDSGQVLLGADVLVTDPGGAPIPCDSGELEFTVEVSRNGQAGPYEVVDAARVHRACSTPIQGDLALVFDNSHSLEKDLDTIKAAALSVSERVLDGGGKVSLTRVSTNAHVLTPLSADHDAVSAAIDGMFITNGWTALYDGVRMGNETLGQELEDPSQVQSFANADAFCSLGRSRNIVVFTDGGENNSSGQQEQNDKYPGDGINTSLDDVLTLNLNAGATPVYTVGLGDHADHAALTRISDATGGRHVALGDVSGIKDVLNMLAQYSPSAHRICTELPDQICGSIDVRISHRYIPAGSADAGAGNADAGGLHASTDAGSGTLSVGDAGAGASGVIEGSVTRHLELPCPVRAQGRVETILLSMTKGSMPGDDVNRLAAQSVGWVSPVDTPRVLFVRDGFHCNDAGQDTGELHTALSHASFTTTFIDEPKGGLDYKTDLKGYDVVWFSNPTYPMNNIKSFNALRQFSQAGGGLVMQGDAMSAPFGQSFAAEPLTQLKHVDNGTSYCGTPIGGSTGGKYDVSFAAQTHAITAGLEGQHFQSTEHIDTTSTLPDNNGGSIEVVAAATLAGAGSGCGSKPVIVAYTPKQNGK